MTHAARPTQIAAILKTIDADYPSDIAASLEAYLSDLEAKQPERPAQIDAILKTMGAELPAEMGASLETYISDLEANQTTVLPSKGAPAHDTAWLYWQTVKREQRRRARALRKQNNYQ